MKETRKYLFYWVGGWIFDFTKAVTFLAFALLIVHYFFYSVMMVKGQSMESTFRDSDITLVNRVQYRIHQPTRGDVISLYFPGETEKKFIKRVIGLPGEKIAIKNGLVYINDKLLDEPYLKKNYSQPDLEILLDQEEFFVLGDNRDLSSDSRIWGPLPKEYLLGEVTTKIGNTTDWYKKIRDTISSLLPGRAAG